MPDSSKVDPDLVKELIEHHYVQHLIKTEVHKNTVAYWDGRRKAIVALISTAIATVAIFGFQMMDVFNLKKRLEEADKQIAAATVLAGDLSAAAKKANAESATAKSAAADAKSAADSIRKTTQESLNQGSQFFKESLVNSNALIAATTKHMQDNANAGDNYVKAAAAMMTPIQQTSTQLSSTAQALKTEVDGLVTQAKSASTTAKAAAADAEKASQHALNYRTAADKILEFQKQLATAWTSETINILSAKKGKEGTRSRPTVRMKHPAEQNSDYEFTFEMASPRDSVFLKATIKNLTSGTKETLCHREDHSGSVHGNFYKLGSSPFFIRPDFVYQSVLADDFVTLRVVATAPAEKVLTMNRPSCAGWNRPEPAQ